MQEFATKREALDFLAGRIAAQAQRENIPLSEVERKMLYFSETDWTLPEIAEVSKEFDRDYDEDQCEQKIARLVADITAHHHNHNQEENERWDAAVYRLSDGDRYLQVLLNLAPSTKSGTPKGHGFAPMLDSPAIRPPHDRLKLWVTAFAIVLAFPGLMTVGNWLFGPRFWAVADWFFSDRDHLALIFLSGIAFWFLWSIRGHWTLILKSFLNRP